MTRNRTLFALLAALVIVGMAWPVEAQQNINTLLRDFISNLRGGYFTVGSADTSGCRIDVSAGVLRIREGDDSADCPMSVGALTASGVAKFADGSAGAPSVAFAGDPDTGMYWINSSGGVIGFSVQGANVATVQSTGFNIATGAGLRSSSVGTKITFPAVDGQVLFSNNLSSNDYRIAVADWGTTLSAESVSWANDQVQAGPSSGVGTLTLSIGTDNNVCVFALTGTSAPVELHDSASICSITATTASSVNVYYSSGYQIENKRGGTRAIRAVFIGG